MPKIKIDFFIQEVTLRIKNRREIKKCLSYLISQEKPACFTTEVNVIFCSDDYLSELNSKYLKHDTLTDIITFDYSEKEELKGDIFISIDRVNENAGIYSQSKTQELIRVIIHGFLHLCGYKDKKPKEKQEMTDGEDKYIAIFEKFVKEKNAENSKVG